MTVPLTTHSDQRYPESGPAPAAAAPARSAGRRLADIQGLRGVAVFLVVVYHANLGVLPGGYIGVDVFFVISGFLITRHLVDEHRSAGRIGLAAFYARRIKRLLPASSLVLLATLVMARVLLPPLGWLDISKAGKATALYVVNLYLAITKTNYLANTAPSPFQHYWSLALEEQFYLFWPLMFIVLLGIRRRGRHVAGVKARIATPVVAAVVVVSFLLSVYLTRTNQPFAFFLLPARAWELGLGGLIALTQPRIVAAISPRLRPFVSTAGFAIIVVTALVINENTPFPGWVAALPVLGAGLCICAAIVPGDPRVANWSPLNFGLLGWLGNISYSLYLWHWPLFIVPGMYRDHALSYPVRGALLALSVLLGWLTWKFVEQTFQRQRPPLKVVFGAGAVVTVISLAACVLVAHLPVLNAGQTTEALPAGTSVASSQPISFVPSNLTPTLRHAAADLPVSYSDGCQAELAAVVPKPCYYGPAEAAHTLVLFGDSHAAQWLPTLQQLTGPLDFRIMLLTKSACPSIEVTAESTQLGREYHECDTWRSRSLALIKAAKPDAVFLGNWEGSTLITHGQSLATAWGSGLSGTLAQLPSSAKVLVMGDTPKWKVTPAICASGRLKAVEDCAKPLDDVVDAGLNKALQTAAKQDPKATYVNPDKWLCPGGQCPVIQWNVLVYRDDHHITATYAKDLAPQLSPAIKAVLG